MNDNNDWRGGKKGKDAPPDLEEIFRNLNQKLSRLLGAKKGGNGQGGGMSSPEPSGALRGGLFTLLGMGVALWLATGFYVVDASEVGVVLRMGSFSRTSDSGLQWHAPYPLEKVEIVSLTQLRSVEVGYRGNAKNRIPEESLMLTEDQNIIDVQLSVQSDVKDAKAFLFNNLTADKDAKDIVKQATETAIREVVGGNKVDFVLNEGRAQIASEAAALIQHIIDRYNLGVRISKVNINDVQPPEQVLSAFDDAVKAGQDKEKLRNEGTAYANDVIPKASGMASRLLEESEGYKQRVVSNAEGEASRFKQVLAEYSKAPAVTRERLYIDMMQQVLNTSSKVLVDQKAGNNLLYLPLDKLMQQGQATPPAGTPSTANTGSTPPPVAPVASSEPTPAASTPPVPSPARSSGREVTRSRDMESR